MAKAMRVRDRQVKAISIAIQAGVPICVIGAPGTGKTKTENAIAAGLNRKNYTVIAGLREPSDFAGLPVIINGEVHMAAPQWAKDAARNKGIVFFDEITCTSPRTQAAMLRVVNENVCGDQDMTGVSFVLAGNPADQAAGGYDLTGPMANRLCWMTWETDHDSWCEGMMSGFTMPALPRLPENWEDQIPQTRAWVSGFIHSFPQKQLILPENEAGWGGPWPSPRTWDMASRLMAACKAAGINGEVEAELLAGCVGHGLALEFITWLRDMDMPDPESIIKNPESFKIPNRNDKTYTVLASVAACIVSKLTTERWNAGWKVLKRAAEQGTVDIAAAAARQLASNRPKGAPAPEEAAVFLPLFQAAGLLGGD